MRHRLGIILSLTSVIFLSGCVYYNAFFVARKKFNQAEQKQAESLRAKEGQQNAPSHSPNQPSRAGNAPQQSPNESNVAPEARVLYKDAIDKANRVITFHPDSKWVPDALWLIGKSYFSMGDFVTADRKFKELVTNHPKSKYADRCYYYMGLCQMNLDHNDQALSAFASIENAPKKSPYLGDVIFSKGVMDMLDESYPDAIGFFSQYLDKYAGDSAAIASYYIGFCNEKLLDYWGAYNAYNSVKDHRPSKGLYFDATLSAAGMALESDSLALGMKILDILAKDQRYLNRAGEINNKTADGFYRMKQLDKAIALYKDVTTQNTRTNASAEAYYRLGLIYQNDKFDLVAAKDAFTKAQSESPESGFRGLALARSAQIAKLENYQAQLQRADSLKMIDELNALGTPDVPPANVPKATVANLRKFIGPLQDTTVLAEEDSLKEQNIESKEMIFIGPQPQLIGPTRDLVSNYKPRRIPPIIGPMPDSAQGLPSQTPATTPNGKMGKSIDQAYDDSVRLSIVNAGIETRFLLSELYAYELNRPDSALQEYLLIVNEYPTSAYAPRALLAAAQIELGRSDTNKANIYLRRLLTDYTKSPQAAQAAEMLNSPFDISNNAMGLYAAAESLVYEANMPDSGIVLYKYIAENFPDLAPMASYAVALILEQVINVEDSSAYNAYSAVARDFPQTIFGAAAKDRLTAAPVRATKPKATTKEEPAASDSASLQDQNPDSTNQFAQGLTLAPPIKVAGEFMYPEALYSRDLKGKVIFKIRLEVTGKVRDYEIIGPSGEYAIDSSATAALTNTEFDVSNLDLSQLNDYFQYSLVFKRPNISQFDNPYIRRQEQGP
jgi:TonB family protein